MSLYPAATFSATGDASRNARLSQTISWGSPLYVIHKDITKTLESPNSINEIIDGNETEAQYSVILDVPVGARGFIPFWVLNCTFNASTAYPNEFKINVVTTGTNPLRYHFIGRTPNWGSDNAYTPYSIGMTNAPDPSTYGYWHGLAAVRLTTATGGGSDNFIAYGTGDNTSATPSAYSIPVSSSNGLTRTYVPSCHNARASNVGLENLIGVTIYPATTTPAGMTGDSGMIPLFGCDKLTCFGTWSGSAPTITAGANMGSGTLSSITAGLAVRFVS